MLCNRHRYNSRTLSSSWRKTLYSLSTHSATPGNHHLLTASFHLLVLNMPFKWKHTISGLSSFTWYYAFRFTRVAPYVSTLFTTREFPLISFCYSFLLIILTTCSLITKGSSMSKMVVFLVFKSPTHILTQNPICSHLQFFSSSTQKDHTQNQESGNPNNLGFIYLFPTPNT